MGARKALAVAAVVGFASSFVAVEFAARASSAEPPAARGEADQLLLGDLLFHSKHVLGAPI